MALKNLPKRRTQRTKKDRPRKVLNQIVEDSLIRRVSFQEYQNKVRTVYDGPQGAWLAACSFLSLHVPLGDRLFRERKFDLRGAKRILDVGCGAGQISKHLIKYADPDASITCFDLSRGMVRRARQRLKSSAPTHLVADVTMLPFAEASFDCVTCGYVLEHLPDARPGLSELARVMVPGGRLLLLTTEDNFPGACTSRMWCCRTYNRRELQRLCRQVGLEWKKELWFTRMHKILRAGGICVVIEKQGNPAA
jgi:ubiquinone/menaquinone biosynthesis C-methylase UbiE